MWQAGCQQFWYRADGVFHPGRVVEVQHRQLRQGCQRTQVPSAKGLCKLVTTASAQVRVHWFCKVPALYLIAIQMHQQPGAGGALLICCLMQC